MSSSASYPNPIISTQTKFPLSPTRAKPDWQSVGHTSIRSKQSSSPTSITTSIQKLGAAGEVHSTSLLKFHAIIEGKPALVMIDSGASCCFISETLSQDNEKIRRRLESSVTPVALVKEKASPSSHNHF